MDESVLTAEDVLAMYRMAEEHADECGECRPPYNFCGCCWANFLDARKAREAYEEDME